MAGRIQQSSSPAPAPYPPTVAAPLTLDHKSEARRAYREARTAIALLQQRWPAAFPEGPQQVRPLITGLTSLIVAELDWSDSYARAVLRTWKLRPAYCHAVLAHPVRFDLEGNPTDQPIDEETRTQAKARLAAWANKRRRPAPHEPPGSSSGATTASPTQAPEHR
jgi:sRNA-binding protein